MLARVSVPAPHLPSASYTHDAQTHTNFLPLGVSIPKLNSLKSILEVVLYETECLPIGLAYWRRLDTVSHGGSVSNALGLKRHRVSA